MALSYVIYEADGGTDLFTVPFGYLNREHVKVYVNAGLLVENVGYTWFSSTQIELTAMPDDGDQVRIVRDTPLSDAAYLDFTAGSTLREEDLDSLNLQMLYIAEELRDAIDGVTTGTVPRVFGTANRISVTEANTPVDYTVNIAATYVGQTSITTLGTIVAGVWSATAIGVTKGGTGLTGITANRIPYATATDTIGTSPNLTFTGSVLNVTGKIGVNTASPDSIALVHLQTEDNTFIIYDRYSSDAFESGMLVRKARGTIASPADVQNGDLTSLWGASGYFGGAFRFVGAFGWLVDGTPSGSNVPSKFVLTTNNGSSTDVRYLISGGGVSEFQSITRVVGAGGTVGSTGAGIEFRGSTTPSLTAYNRATSAYLPMIHDAASHEFDVSGVVGMALDSSRRLTITTVSSEAFAVVRTNTDEASGMTIYNLQPSGYGNSIRFYSTDSDGVTTAEAAAIGVYGEQNWSGAGNRSSNIRFYTRNANTLAERLRITANGQLTLSGPGISLTGTLLSIAGPSIAGSSAWLQFASGSTATVWNNQNNSTELMRLTNSGLLGLNVSATPDDYFHIKAGDTNVGIRMENSGSGGKIWRLISGRTGSSLGAGAFGFINESDGITAVVITADGRLGVSKGGSTVVPPSGVSFFVKDTAGAVVRFVRSTDTDGFEMAYDDSNGYISTTNSVPMIIRTNNTTAVTISTSQAITVAGGIVGGAATGGDKGAGTINIAGLYYANGTAGVTTFTGAVTSITIKNGIVTAIS